MTNLEKLEQAKKAGFEYRGEKIIETYRDNWVYSQRQLSSDEQKIYETVNGTHVSPPKFESSEWDNSCQ